MSRSPRKPGVAPKVPAGEEEILERLDELLDEGLKETFPASDPPALVAPRHDTPTGDED